jgi:hypothetical protein
MPICHGWMSVTNARSAAMTAAASVISKVQLLVDDDGKRNDSMLAWISKDPFLRNPSLSRWPAIYLGKYKEYHNLRLRFFRMQFVSLVKLQNGHQMLTESSTLSGLAILQNFEEQHLKGN